MRIRTIKPEIFTHAELYDLECELGCPVRFAWAGLWCVCDREGRFMWEPRRLGVLILPFDCAAGLDFSRVLDAWLTRGFVRKYRVADVWVGCIPSWRRHQFINGRECKSVLPDIAQAEEVADACSTRDSRVPHAIQDGRGRGRGKGKERIEEATASSCAEPELALRSAPAPENGTPMHPTLFPVIGKPEPVQIAESKAAEYRETFAGIDIDAELAKAAQWLRDNPSRRKTAKGLPRYLFAWLERAQNRSQVQVQGQARPQQSAFAPRPSLGALQIELSKVREEIADILHPGGCAGTVEPTGEKRTRYDALVARRQRIQAQIEGLT